MFLFRAARRNLDKISGNFRRIWMTVPSDFPVARRWARALGFHFNRNLPGYGLLGETHLEYVKWQPEL